MIRFAEPVEGAVLSADAADGADAHGVVSRSDALDTATPNAVPDDAELDALEDLGDEIATLAAHIHAATQRLLELIATHACGAGAPRPP